MKGGNPAVLLVALPLCVGLAGCNGPASPFWSESNVDDAAKALFSSVNVPDQKEREAGSYERSYAQVLRGGRADATIVPNECADRFRDANAIADGTHARVLSIVPDSTTRYLVSIDENPSRIPAVTNEFAGDCKVITARYLNSGVPVGEFEYTILPGSVDCGAVGTGSVGRIVRTVWRALGVDASESTFYSVEIFSRANKFNVSITQSALTRAELAPSVVCEILGESTGMS